MSEIDTALDDWNDEDQREWLTFDYLARAGTNDAEAAGMLCRWLECILDGQRAICGGPTELPRPGVAGMSAMDDAEYRALVRDIDERYWDMATQVLAVPGELVEGAEMEEDDGSTALVRMLLSAVQRQRGEGGDDWYEDRRYRCVAGLVEWVRRYRRNLALAQHNRDEADGREIRELLEDIEREMDDDQY